MGPRNTIVADAKHGVGVMIDKDGNQEPIFGTPETPTTNPSWHTGIDPLDNIQISVASKKRFLEWYKLHSTNYPIRNHKGVVDSGKVIRLHNEGINVIGAAFGVIDHQLEEFPFKMYEVENFVINMPNLHSLKNCPKYCKSGQFGAATSPMKYMDSLIGCPEIAKSLTVYTEACILNLRTSLIQPIASLTIYAPYFACFEGLNVEVEQLHLTAYEQKSFKGIHRALKSSNIKAIRVGVTIDFPGGVLPFAMLDPGIDVYSDITINPPVGFTESMEIVNECRKVQMNIHDIQERLIDAGLGKYARL